jgi:cytochrome c-type biogenesis protein CcmH/NrfF
VKRPKTLAADRAFGSSSRPHAGIHAPFALARAALALLLLVPIAGLAIPTQSLAQASSAAPGGLTLQAASERSQRIADELRSPFCPGKTLLTCTSGQAFTARQEIRDRLLAGESEEAIIQDFRTRYGEDIVNPPQPWYAVVSPFIPALVGVIFLGIVTWRWRKGRGVEGPDGAAGQAAQETGGADADRLARLRRQVAAEDE